jgi:hypothetical protein
MGKDRRARVGRKGRGRLECSPVVHLVTVPVAHRRCNLCTYVRFSQEFVQFFRVANTQRNIFEDAGEIVAECLRGRVSLRGNRDFRRQSSSM